ncbi:acireductone dioxygenase [Synechococcus sp. A15-60]|uniref:1,2-dihydroxy-3-keto-5-methylthiopentene dioxygenase n=1 Tax=Synechococcus sp. A15-60 TaxID=1050655 RepID=UPI0016495796|nr:acireductone dioxygenase [Synechococcus sp. A15-60]QNI49278.1 1/2-dihydroxy-3-keto-5-methylthiopentene dioxygenase [Synechococcus sp. A15-60]
MSELTLFSDRSSDVLLHTQDRALIERELKRRGIGFERWLTQTRLDQSAGQEEILAAYKHDIQRTQARGNYPTVDAIRIQPDHPERATLRQTFLNEHTHSEDEVRFFVEGHGLFCLHLGDEVIQVLCKASDWISVPAGTRHWFDMGPEPEFCAIRFFCNPSGWVADFTGDSIASRYPLLTTPASPL